MYEEYWKVNRKPFRNTPDPAFFYSAKPHEDVLMKLAYAVTENMGAAMLTGAYGCGKTLLSVVLVSQLGDRHVVAACSAQPEMGPLDLLRTVARALGDEPLPSVRSDLVTDALLETIGRRLRENARDGKHTVITIDEAHLMDGPAALETTRLLLNFHEKDRFLLTLLLLGHPELADRVSGLKQLAQRIPISCGIGPFDREDTGGYVRSRLAVAGRREGPFQEDALTYIHRNSGGIPRRINTLCDVSLAMGCAQKAEAIDASLVMAASEKFGVV